MTARLVLAGTLVAVGLGASSISPAEEMLFQRPHLSGLKPPTTLSYRFEDGGVGDALTLSLKARDGGACCLAAMTARGEAFSPLPPEIEATGNPVILVFLERDVRRMQAATGGQSNYFRRLIRLALADQAKVEAAEIRYGGKAVAARRITVEPYRTDARLGQDPAIAAKTYSFVLAEAVPGGVYQLKTQGGPPPAQAVLTLEETAP